MQQNNGIWNVFLATLLIGALALVCLMPVPKSESSHAPAHFGHESSHQNIHRAVEREETPLTYLVRRARELFRPLTLRN